METFVKAIQDRNLSTKYNNLFAIELQQLKESYVSLIQRESFENTHFEGKSDEIDEKEQKVIEQVESKRKTYFLHG